MIFSSKVIRSCVCILAWASLAFSAHAQGIGAPGARDITSDDWAYNILRRLETAYECNLYPHDNDERFTLTEANGLLDACMDQINDLFRKARDGEITKGEYSRLRQNVIGMNEFVGAFRNNGPGDLATRVAFLENNQFATTTKLQGEVLFALGDDFGGGDNRVFSDRVRLNFEQSFTGSDTLRERLGAGNVGNANGTFDDDWTAMEYAAPKTGFFEIVDRDEEPILLGPDLADSNPFDTPTNTRETPVSVIDRRRPRLELGLDIGRNLSISDYRLDTGGGTFQDFRTPFNSATYWSIGLTIQDLVDLTPDAGPDDVNVTGYLGVAYSESDGGVRSLINRGGTFDGVVNATYRGRTEVETFWLRAGVNIYNPRFWNPFGDEGGVLQIGGAIGSATATTRQTGGMFSDTTKDTPFALEMFYRFKVNSNVTIGPGLMILFNGAGGESDDTVYIGAIRTTFTF